MTDKNKKYNCYLCSKEIPNAEEKEAEKELKDSRIKKDKCELLCDNCSKKKK